MSRQYPIYLSGNADGDKVITRGARDNVNINVLVGASSVNSYNVGNLTIEREEDEKGLRSFIISFKGVILSVIDYNTKTKEFTERNYS